MDGIDGANFGGIWHHPFLNLFDMKERHILA